MESSSDCATELDLPAPGAERPLTDWLCATALPPASPTRMPEQRFEYLDLPLAAALRRRARRLQSRPIRLPGPARTA